MNPAIKIFRRNSGVDCAFESFQSIPSGEVNDIVLIDFGTLEVMSKLLVTVNHTHLEVRQQQGHSGFHDSAWSVPVDGGSSIQPWLTDDDHRLFLIIGQTRKCTGSLVFEVLTRGSTLLPVTFKNSNQCKSVVT